MFLLESDHFIFPSIILRRNGVALKEMEQRARYCCF